MQQGINSQAMYVFPGTKRQEFDQVSEPPLASFLLLKIADSERSSWPASRLFLMKRI
jgi:hypothetical protein